MYKGNVCQVAFKELLQNSFDAVKKNANPKIKIGTDFKKNCIFCIDNGIGMSPDTVQNVYLKIGGTLKDNLDVTERSGGLGIAKVQFFLSAQRLYVDTIKDGKRTILDCLQEELFSGEACLTVEDTDLPNGTTVMLFYPHQVVNLDGTTTCIEVPSCLPSSIEHPLLGYPEIAVNIDFPWETSRNINRLPIEFSNTASWEFHWGKVTAYYAPSTFKPGSRNWTEIYSAGLYQFDKQFYKNPFYLEYDVKLNIQPYVAAGMAGYPFNNTREGFNVSVEEDIKTIQKYLFDIQAVLNSELVRLMFDNMGSLRYLDIDGTKYEHTRIEGASNNLEFSEEFKLRIQKAFFECESVYEKKQIVEEANLKLAASKEEVEAHKNENLKFKNATTGNYEIGDILFSKIASVVIDSFDYLPEEDKVSKKCPTVAGIHIQKNGRYTNAGELVTGNINALFLNPLACNYFDNGNCWVEFMVDTLIHEFAHIQCVFHNDEFTSRLVSIKQWFISRGNYEKIYGKFTAIYQEHAEEICELSREFANSRSI